MTEHSNTQGRKEKEHDMKKMRTVHKGGICDQSGTADISREEQTKEGLFSSCGKDRSIGKCCLQGMVLEEISERQC